MSPRITAVQLSLLGPALLLASAARADVNELVGRVPAQANTVLAVNAEFVAPADAGGAPPPSRPRSPVPLPKVAGLRSLVLAARVHTTTLEPAWEVALMEVGQKPSMQALALASGGYVDTAAGKPAAVCPNDVFCVEISDKIIGAVYPADRQLATFWLNQLRPGSASQPQDYLLTAVAGVGRETPVVLAIDLTDAVSEAAVRRLLETEAPKWAGSLRGDNKAAAVLASVRGVTIRIGTLGGGGATGTIAVDFSQDVAPLAAVAKDMVCGVMADRGVSVPDMAQWEFTASGRALNGHGRLTVQGIGRLVEFLSPPAVSAPGEPTEARTAAGSEAASPKEAAAVASKAYFKSVSGNLDAFQAGESLSDSAAWLNRSAKRIDQLPAQGVDPDLLMWGADVSAKLREAASILSAGQQRVKARSASIGTNVGYAGIGGSAESQRAAQARADRENLRRQASQLAAEERANVQLEASKPLVAAMDSRGKTRAAMVERYGGGF
jgi:hypothetical protein